MNLPSFLDDVFAELERQGVNAHIHAIASSGKYSVNVALEYQDKYLGSSRLRVEGEGNTFREAFDECLNRIENMADVLTVKPMPDPAPTLTDDELPF